MIALGSGFGQPRGVAVDSSRNIYVDNGSTNAVDEILAVGGYKTVTSLFGGFNTPSGITSICRKWLKRRRQIGY